MMQTKSEPEDDRFSEIRQQTETRISRAEHEDMSARRISSDPLVVEVSNESNDSVHTVVPDALHCSCEDHTYRQVQLCKHLIFLANDTDRLAEATRQTITDELVELQDEEMELRSRLTAVREAREELVTVREGLDMVLDYDDEDRSTEHSEASEGTETQFGYEDYEEWAQELEEAHQEDELPVDDDIDERVESAEPVEHSEFQEMIDDLQ